MSMQNLQRCGSHKVAHLFFPGKRGAMLLVGAFLLATSGCSVNDHKTGQSQNVQLRTPVGALDVRTNAVRASDVGLPTYPGAVEVAQKGDDSGSADVNMSFGKWRLHVKAVDYQSSDPEDKILVFYKGALAKFGDVLTCKDKIAVGQPAKTRGGLTCSNDHEYQMGLKLDTSNKNASMKIGQVSGDVKLLAGSTDNQHIVEINPVPDGTKFSLVVVQLPHKDQTD